VVSEEGRSDLFRGKVTLGHGALKEEKKSGVTRGEKGLPSVRLEKSSPRKGEKKEGLSFPKRGKPASREKKGGRGIFEGGERKPARTLKEGLSRCPIKRRTRNLGGRGEACQERERCCSISHASAGKGRDP